MSEGFNPIQAIMDWNPLGLAYTVATSAATAVNPDIELPTSFYELVTDGLDGLGLPTEVIDEFVDDAGEWWGDVTGLPIFEVFGKLAQFIGFAIEWALAHPMVAIGAIIGLAILVVVSPAIGPAIAIGGALFK